MVISSEVLEYDEMRASLMMGDVGRGGEVGACRVRMVMESGVVGEGRERRAVRMERATWPEPRMAKRVNVGGGDIGKG